MYFFVQPLKSQYPDTNSPSLGPGSSLGEKGEKNPHGRKQSKPGGSRGGGGGFAFFPFCCAWSQAKIIQTVLYTFP